MAAKRRADSAASSFSIMYIMLILSIMFLALCNKLEIASKTSINAKPQSRGKNFYKIFAPLRLRGLALIPASLERVQINYIYL